MLSLLHRPGNGWRNLRRTCLALAFASLAGAGWAVAAADVLAIVPEVGEPYRSVLQQIVEGIRQTATVRLVQIPPNAGAGQQTLSIIDERVVIALGSTAVTAAAPLQARRPLVAGAIVTPAGQPPLPGVSLETDPSALFKRLLELRPGIRKVHWLYRPARSGWLRDAAQTAASRYKLQLVAVPIDNARSAAQRYQEILNQADNQTEAVWLSQDPALIGNDSALPDILDRAWTNNIVVFSGSVQHVAHGVLFALFPDNVAMGADLARLALAQADGTSMQFEPNRGLQSAINRRTAEHLGITPTLSQYDLVLPAR